MEIIINKTKVKILVSNKNLDKKIDCRNCSGLIIDYSPSEDFYTVEFEYIDKDGEIDTDIAFLKKEEFLIIA